MTHKGYRCVKVEEPVAGVLKVVLARPKHLNAMNGDMIDDLLSLSDEIVSVYPDRYRAIVLTGEGRAFCSGGDIDYFRTILSEPRNAVESVIARFHLFARIWYQLPLPTIAVLSGAAAGGGAALALLCDIRYAAPDANIGFSFVNIGLVPDFGSHFLLPALVGRDKALELMYSGDFVSAEEAARIGLITRIFPRESAESEAVALAARLAGKSPDVLRSIKKLAGEARNLSFAEVLAREVETQAGRFKTPEFEAQVREFLARS
jgi:2-(1,2-epoxy-1,2-dihydrophenyl)acetyl-CoA isomerase